MTTTITIASTKGGVGKTTLAANLGGLLADLGRRVLLVDADVQPTLSSYYPLVAHAGAGLVHLLTGARVTDIVSRTAVAGLDIIVSDDAQGRLPAWILHAPDGRVRLKHRLEQFADDYDVVLIDTQGAIGPLQDAAVLAADLLISPLPPEMLSAREFARGTLRMLERLAPMHALGAPVGPLRALLYRVDRTVDARRIAEEMRREIGDREDAGVSVLETVVPSTVAYREAATARLPVHRWERRRRGPTASGRATMHALVAELFDDGVTRHGPPGP